MIPTEGTARVVTSAERFIYCSLSEEAAKLFFQFVRADVGAMLHRKTTALLKCCN